ncbi:MAG TPA: FtsX-like permease family protein, partial [Polyangiaceae bacterium]|nr:FtsX-like permease family protein [Polyangiaceae bacterium]
TVSLVPEPSAAPADTARQASTPTEAPRQHDAREETHEDYQVMRSAIRLGSLSAFLVGALVVFFSLAVVVEHRRREVALLRSLGATARQAAGVFVREAAWVGLAGAALGFVLAIPMTYVAARLGITTTGRARIASIVFPWGEMFGVSVLGGLTALLGVVPPVRRILRLHAPDTLRPHFLDAQQARAYGKKTSGITLVVLPMGLLVYGLLRPLFSEVLPSLAFFVLEAVLVMLALFALLLVVPGLTRSFGGLLAQLFLRGPAAARLLVVSRIRRQGDELAWSVGGIMLVFSLLLSLHISTHALKAEVSRFAETALRGHAFIFSTVKHAVPAKVRAAVPAGYVTASYSGGTPLPNRVSAVSRADLLAFARATGRPELMAVAERFDGSTMILSTLMARRFGVGVGDRLTLASPAGQRTLEVVGVTDAAGFVPAHETYRNTKTYAIVEATNYPLIEPFAAPIGNALVITSPHGQEREASDWRSMIGAIPRMPGVFMLAGRDYEWIRRRETDGDFAIFDLMLLLTSVLAAVGVANQLMLAVHARRREIALLRVLGMTPAQIRKMLLLEGSFVGLLGGVLAVILGIPLGFGSLAALELVSAFDVRFELPLLYILLTVVGAIGVSLLAALYPARRAAQAQSAESIHYE